MNEYYYTHSLATAASAIEQGFEDCETYDKGLFRKEYEWHKGFDPRTEYEQWRFPKSPHNVALMKPKINDLVFTSEKDYCIINYDAELFDIKHGVETVIYRNNKPFPVWGKIEEKKDGI